MYPDPTGLTLRQVCQFYGRGAVLREAERRGAEQVALDRAICAALTNTERQLEEYEQQDAERWDGLS